MKQGADKTASSLTSLLVTAGLEPVVHAENQNATSTVVFAVLPHGLPGQAGNDGHFDFRREIGALVRRCKATRRNFEQISETMISEVVFVSAD